MKANRLLRAVAATAAAALTIGLGNVVVDSAAAVTKSTVTLLSTGDITSLNSSTSAGNTTYNATVGSLTGMGFSYYNSDAKLVMNTTFGTMKIVKKAPKDFQIQYTVRKGQVWSDGTPIDAVDLLLSHVIQSDAYSKAAKLGDPKTVTPKFDSVAYGSTYGTHVVGLPVVSADHYSLTVKFDKPLPDWELLAPGPSPVHTLEMLADNKKALGTASANLAAKAQFLKDFTTKNTARLTKMGNVWTNSYNVNAVTAATSPLLLVSNGGFIIKSFTYGDKMTLVRNPKYTSGPAMATKNPIKTVVIKIIKDNTAAVQALRNGDIDIYYNTLPSSADKASLSAMTNVVTLTKTGGNYSHLDLRVDTANGKTDDYTGLFAGDSQKARDLRTAFLLAVPRVEMVQTLIAPIQTGAKPLDTAFAFQGTPEYNTIVKSSGVSLYTTGDQAARTAKALALVKKYKPAASADNQVYTVRLVHADSGTRRRLTALIKLEVAKAGFDLVESNEPRFFDDELNASSSYDATMYGFGLNSLSQSNGTEIYKSDGGNNVWGWNDSTVDALAASLQGDILTPAQVTAKRLAIDKLVMKHAWGLTLYANPTITAYTKTLKNVKPAPVGANTTWNFFEWHY
jgi:peptide/nickel transport system substrate-binding protein